jgi:hypothetical protein
MELDPDKKFCFDPFPYLVRLYLPEPDFGCRTYFGFNYGMEPELVPCPKMDSDPD